MITCFGSITKERIVFGAHTEERLGGTSIFFDEVCKELNEQRRIVSVIGKKEAGTVAIDKSFLQLTDHGTEIVITETTEDVTCEIEHLAGKIDVGRVPNECFESSILFVSTFLDEVDLAAVKARKREGSLLALDIQGFTRDPSRKFLSDRFKRAPSGLPELLADVDILKCNELEAALLVPDTSIEGQLSTLGAFGPQRVLITQGKKGVTLLDHGKILHIPAEDAPLKHTVGAGDIFFSSFLVWLSRTDDAALAAKKANAHVAKKLGPERIAVIGSCDDSEEFGRAKALAVEIGRLLARTGHPLLFGVENDMDSLPVVAALAAKEAGGNTIGFNHGSHTIDKAGASTELVNTGLQRGGPREFEIVRSCDMVVVVGGGSGTLMEIAMAYQLGKRIILMIGSGGWADKLDGEHLDSRKRVAFERVHAIEELERVLE